MIDGGRRSGFGKGGELLQLLRGFVDARWLRHGSARIGSPGRIVVKRLVVAQDLSYASAHRLHLRKRGPQALLIVFRQVARGNVVGIGLGHQRQDTLVGSRLGRHQQIEAATESDAQHTRRADVS